LPFTLFHFGPNAALSLPLRKHLDAPVFILASVVVDLEPLTVMVFNLDYPLHGYLHTFIFGGIIGAMWGFLAYLIRKPIGSIMAVLRLQYNPNISKAVLSGFFGVWFHILLDAPLYSDIMPFYPIKSNHLLGLISSGVMYLACTIAFLPTIVFYIKAKSISGVNK
jgi:membrane-bound metal-dependent hydrolase YbcI (DUF457 family)